MFVSDNTMLASLSMHIDITQVSCLYDVTSCELPTPKIKHSVWNVFQNSIELQRRLNMCVSVPFLGLVFVFLLFPCVCVVLFLCNLTFYMLFSSYCMWLPSGIINDDDNE